MAQMIVCNVKRVAHIVWGSLTRVARKVVGGRRLAMCTVRMVTHFGLHTDVGRGVRTDLADDETYFTQTLVSMQMQKA